MTTKEQDKQVLIIPDYLTVRELADLMRASPIEVMKQLIANGIMASINQQIDYDTAAIVIEEMGFQARSKADVQKEEERQKAIENLPAWKKQYAQEDSQKLSRRPPVVTILGHVDHGKTSLLDVIRKAHVAEGEAGGITQHIGAYQIEHNSEKITFLDTPGHAAFTAMRARGAQGADVAVLVVAADDGVMPTTREALNHVRAADVPVVVALNKVDKPNANPDLVKNQLSEMGLTPDEWGGSTLVVPVSAKTGQGIQDLLEAILMTASEQDIQANPNRDARGVVLESRTESGRGPVATLLVQNGTLKVGDVVVAGTAYGKIKAMFDENNNRLQSATPSRPALVMGLDHLPSAGDSFEVVKDVKAARVIVEQRETVASEAADSARTPTQTLESFFAQFNAGETSVLRLIVKVDVDGSLQPIVDSLESIKVSDKGLKVDIIHAEVGEITENDINLAQSTGSIVIGFNVDPDNAARRAAENYGVDIRTYTVIYTLLEDIELALQGMLEPVYEDRVMGRAEVRAVFRIPKIGHIAGCMVMDGAIRRNQKARVMRRGQEVAHKQSVTSLKRHTEDVREVRQGFECGIGLADFEDFQEGDIVEFLESVRVS
ncbi:MAG: translation initiation factor IF-2 [Anaerolineae bacterium]|nr:translation initiation factor IF-2 [Anaerolineae bacterium]